MSTHTIFTTKNILTSLSAFICATSITLLTAVTPASAQTYDYDVSTTVAGQYAQRAVVMAEAGQCEEARAAITVAQENWQYLAESSPDQTVNNAVAYVTYRCGYEPGNIEMAITAKQYAAKAVSLAQNGRCEDATNAAGTAQSYWHEYQASRSYLPSTDQTVSIATTQVVSLCIQNSFSNSTTAGTGEAAEGTSTPPVVTAAGTISEQAIALAKSGKCPESIDMLETAKTSMGTQEGNYISSSSSSVATAVAEVRNICANYVAHTEQDDQGLSAFGTMQNAENAIHSANVGRCDEARTYMARPPSKCWTTPTAH